MLESRQNTLLLPLNQNVYNFFGNSLACILDVFLEEEQLSITYREGVLVVLVLVLDVVVDVP